MDRPESLMKPEIGPEPGGCCSKSGTRHGNFRKIPFLIRDTELRGKPLITLSIAKVLETSFYSKRSNLVLNFSRNTQKSGSKQAQTAKRMCWPSSYDNCDVIYVLKGCSDVVKYLLNEIIFSSFGDSKSFSNKRGSWIHKRRPFSQLPNINNDRFLITQRSGESGSRSC